MLKRLTNWSAGILAHHGQRRRRAIPAGWIDYRVEALESRTLLSITLGPLVTNDIPTTKDELVALPVTNTSTDPVTFTAQSSNPNVSASVVTGGRSLVLDVSGVDSNNVAFSGTLIFRLFENEAPVTTSRIISLANTGFYNGLTFHRIIPGFVAQGGDPNGDGTGGSGTKFDDEFNTNLTFTSNGLLAMANSGDDSNDSQFFVTATGETLAQLPQSLNFNYTIFGILTSGADIFQKLMSTPTGANNKPTTAEIINSATVITDAQNGVLRLHAAPGFTGSSTITVTADDGHGNTSQQQFNVNVVPDTINDPAFLGPVSNVTTAQGTPVTLNVQGYDLEDDQLTFVVKDPATFNTDTATGSAPANVAVSIQVTPASGSTPATAAITLTPSATAPATIQLMIGVRDQTNRSGASLDSRANFDTQLITLTVTPVNHAPTSAGGAGSTPLNQALAVQLTGDDGDPDKTQTLSYEIVSQPQNGTISNFNSATGALTYTPTTNFVGVDTFTYRVHDNGGTASGGQDTSALATFTIAVGAPPTPTGLALATASDDGVFSDDRVFSGTTPKFTVAAQAGAVVTFLVNGTTQVAGTETSAGQFTASLTRQMLRVGANTITATASVNGAASPAATALTFTYAPSFDQVYTVPGAFGSTQQITVKYASESTAGRDELGVFTVDSPDGTINGIAPGTAGYAAAALASAGQQVLFIQGASAGGTKTLNVKGGQLLVFYLIGNSSTSAFLSSNPQNDAGKASAFFSVTAANPDGVDHALTTADPQTGQVLMHWEDMRGGGDRDYNDAVITITPGAAASAAIGEALRISGGPAHTVATTFTLQPTRKAVGSLDGPVPGAAQGEFGIFIVSDALGTVSGIAPGSAGYLQAVLSSSTRQVIFNAGDPLGTQKTLQIPGGALIGFYYIPGGTAASVLANNATNDASHTPIALLSFDAANPDQDEHFRWIGPERGGTPVSAANGDSGLNLHLVDKLFASPTDFDDFMMSITMPS